MPWYVNAGLYTVSGVCVVHLNFRNRESQSISLSEVPLVMGLFLMSAPGLLVSRIIGGAIAIALFRRQRGIKLVFNVGNFVAETVVALAIFHGLVGTPNVLGPGSWSAAFLAALASNTFGGLSVIGAISIFQGRFDPRSIRQVLPLAALGAVATSSLALLAVTVLWTDARSSWLLVVVAGVLFVLYRSYTALTTRYANLELLYEFTSGINRYQAVEGVTASVLQQARSLMRAETATIRLIEEGKMGLEVGETELGVDGSITNRRLPFQLWTQDELWAQALREDGPTLATRSQKGEAARQLDALGFKDRIIVPLRTEHGVIGTIEVANRLDEVSTFDPEDMKVFVTIANHAIVSLENSLLIDRLQDQARRFEYQALHDGLTGLPNRDLFRTETSKAIEAAVAARESGKDVVVAVMLMDLDLFKEINDTLGHHTGDRVLREVAARLMSSVGDEGTIARLGGDEFAILLPAIADEYQAVEVAKRVRFALERPFALDEMRLEVAASVGIALCPEHAAEASALLQRADVAMYHAKETGSGVEIYAPERDQYSARRLALVTELREAIQRGELAVFYQPKADLRTGRPVGVEALLRWRHPHHGLVSPDEFIPIAEHTGFIRPLTNYVLDVALDQLAHWHAEGLRIGMAVNLSVRNLLDGDLHTEIATRLRDRGIEPGYVTLEITESSVMADPGRMVGILNRLAASGIKLSIDDFGTGYSSLSYLKRLPVHEVKIDKSFVMNMATDESDATIVRSIIDLGRNLGLRVVAEGVEDIEAWDRLAAFGCDVAQGHLLSEPGSASEISAWMHLHELADLREVRVDMGADMGADMCADMCADARADMGADVRADVDVDRD